MLRPMGTLDLEVHEVSKSSNKWYKVDAFAHCKAKKGPGRSSSHDALPERLVSTRYSLKRWGCAKTIQEDGKECLFGGPSK